MTEVFSVTLRGKFVVDLLNRRPLGYTSSTIFDGPPSPQGEGIYESAEEAEKQTIRRGSPCVRGGMLQQDLPEL